MRISNETISFTYQNFGMRKGKRLREKLEYNGKNEKLSYIIDRNRNIPYILNPDDIATRIANKYIKPILFFIILIIALVECWFGWSGLYIIIEPASNIEIIGGYINIGLSVLTLISAIFLLVIRVIYRKRVNFYELKGSVDDKNYF